MSTLARRPQSFLEAVQQSWLMRSGQRHTTGPDLEIYDSRYHATDEHSTLCYAIPVTGSTEEPSGDGGTVLG